jgi:hypothetical protein
VRPSRTTPARWRARPYVHAARRLYLLMGLLTRLVGMGRRSGTPTTRTEPTARSAGMRRNAIDTEDPRRMAHNPEAAGSNPAPATKARGRIRTRIRPLAFGYAQRYLVAVLEHSRRHDAQVQKPDPDRDPGVYAVQHLYLLTRLTGTARRGETPTAEPGDRASRTKVRVIARWISSRRAGSIETGGRSGRAPVARRHRNVRSNWQQQP